MPPEFFRPEARIFSHHYLLLSWSHQLLALEAILLLKVLQLDVCAPNSHYMLLTSPYKSQLRVISFLLVGLNWKVLCYIQIQNVLSELEFLPLINIAFVTYFLNSLSIGIRLKQIPQFYIQSELMVEHITKHAMQ